jgi:hypothetical protein
MTLSQRLDFITLLAFDRCKHSFSRNFFLRPLSQLLKLLQLLIVWIIYYESLEATAVNNFKS